MKLNIVYIKNMVCNRCIMVVGELFSSAGYQPLKVSLGEVELSKEMEPDAKNSVSKKLKEYGFELIDDHKTQIIEKIKNIIIRLVHHTHSELRENYSSLIESELGRGYTYLSNLFSSVEGITIEKYIIAQKIERVKELLVYHELTLSEIAWQMGYSSVAHLSNQFKKVTGLTPSYFREIGANRRKPLDQV
jgi:AraC-like DNA-binding protein